MEIFFKILKFIMHLKILITLLSLAIPKSQKINMILLRLAELSCYDASCKVTTGRTEVRATPHEPWSKHDLA